MPAEKIRPRERVNGYSYPAQFKCECGLIWDAYGDWHCDCDRWYNAFGQKLNPPSMWGWETGERFDDNGNYIAGGDDDFFD